MTCMWDFIPTFWRVCNLCHVVIVIRCRCGKGQTGQTISHCWLRPHVPQITLLPKHVPIQMYITTTRRSLLVGAKHTIWWSGLHVHDAVSQCHTVPCCCHSAKRIVKLYFWWSTMRFYQLVHNHFFAHKRRTPPSWQRYTLNIAQVEVCTDFLLFNPLARLRIEVYCVEKRFIFQD